ncbi:MAG TPA: endonuclease III [Thermomicrobiales bacterium]
MSRIPRSGATQRRASSIAADNGPDTVVSREKLAAVAARLKAQYGTPRWQSEGDPIAVLVSTILSQSTTDLNTERAFRSLRERFPTWEEVLAAPTSEVAEAIRVGGLADQKAPRIQEVLRRVLTGDGATMVDELETLPVAEARSRLESLPGVGAKTASCVLLFSLGRPAFPVDTHVHRVSRRLGLVPPNASPVATQNLIEPLLGGDRNEVYALHMNLIAHGRSVCRAPRPLCDQCCLTDLCSTYRESRIKDA